MTPDNRRKFLQMILAWLSAYPSLQLLDDGESNGVTRLKLLRRGEDEKQQVSVDSEQARPILACIREIESFKLRDERLSDDVFEEIAERFETLFGK